MPKPSECKGKKRKKNFYVQYQKKPKINTLEAGLQGFLLTCNNDEKRCVREAYNILNEFAETSPDTQDAKSSEDVDEDVEDDLEKELKDLKGGDRKRFQQLYTGVKSCLFIQTKMDPCPLMLKILESIQREQKQRTLSTQKMFPVLGTCKAHLDNLRKCLDDVLDKVKQDSELYQPQSKLEYAVLFRARHNNSLKKEDVVTTTIDMVRSKDIAWEPEPRTPDCAISIDLLSGICCVSVLPFYKKYKRYNLVELAKPDHMDKAVNEPDGTDKMNELDRKEDASKQDVDSKEVETQSVDESKI